MAETTASDPTKILIVDDDTSVRDVIAVLLGEEHDRDEVLDRDVRALAQFVRTRGEAVPEGVAVEGHEPAGVGEVGDGRQQLWLQRRRARSAAQKAH